MQKHTYRVFIFWGAMTGLAGCSSLPAALGLSSQYSMYGTTQDFLSENETRVNGAVIDKGKYYPKSAYSYAYRYCSNTPAQAREDIAQYQNLVKQVCNGNGGQMIHLDSGSWCVAEPNTHHERPYFFASISSTEQWADLCLDGPFITLKVIENNGAPDSEWYLAAMALGYQPFSSDRQLIEVPPETVILTETRKVPGTNGTWTEESEHIYTSIGERVCLYEKPDRNSLGYTYRGTVQNASKGKVRVLIKEKFKGDIRTAPYLEPLEWHQEAYITASASAWFVCSS
ncbi:hypothetical protein [Photobacterium galatheae]|uniref:Lipoprotein n=1 Tax=Photobacterium galatheae TaxID=1654360 RepID=A0A066RGS7_9GAMM|nr:hypothetical protein [Photobacterium galatheae]KDM89625.1 hypothetical protein EA58_21555 [Photobacterium galatheae]MCM0150229.1 hypothetical protein [Photobacterium galatheae]